MSERLLAPVPDVPADFTLGTATSAYQIEGAVHVDGRGTSIWDTFSHTPGRTRNGENGDVAVDHYHRLDEDLDLLAWLGADHYRFSISWPRIVPDGTGEVEPRGLAFYERLVDGLLERGIEPMVTLFHWDLPQPLQDEGGWEVAATAEAFAAYAGVCVATLGDRVTRWSTLNEPWCSAHLGHHTAQFAPGLTDPAAAVRAAHHLMVAHGLALDAMRAASTAVEVGPVLNLTTIRPATDDPDDVAAARLADGVRNRWWLDPVLQGTYPDDVLDAWSQYVDLGRLITDEHREVLRRPNDWLGINYYNPEVVRAGDGGGPPGPGQQGVESLPPEGPLTTMGWPVDATGLVELLARLRDVGAPPLWITECGAAYPDTLEDGRVRDGDRTQYLHDHLVATLQARADGVDVRGFTAWSLLDNFEWAHGYEPRFGIVHVDHETLERTPKDSAHWLRAVIADRGDR